MSTSQSESYRAAGVDINAGYEAVRQMQQHVQRTRTPGVLGGLGGFGGLFALDTAHMPNPVLVSGTDGVGTKLRLAFLMDKHDTIGIDCVAMCVNDIICSGAKPLFFLDYIACGKNEPARIAEIVKGVAEGCVQAGCALIGGETAEMPGSYPANEYDLAGFAVGAVQQSKLVTGSAIQPGDALLALPSSGVHSNGFSLVRRVFGIDENPNVLGDYTQALGQPLGETLLTPTRIYTKPLLALLAALPVLGASHITGGGFFENIPRCLPKGLCAHIQTDTLPNPPIFTLIAQKGNIPRRDMYNTFNMGVGMVVVVPAAYADEALALLRTLGEDAWRLGTIKEGSGGVVF